MFACGDILDYVAAFPGTINRLNAERRACRLPPLLVWAFAEDLR